MKQFASWFTHGVPHGAHLRKAVYEAKTGAEILDAVDHFFEALLSPTVIGKAPCDTVTAEAISA